MANGERRTANGPCPLSRALRAYGRFAGETPAPLAESIDRFFDFTQAPARRGPARSGTGLALGYYLAAPPGRKDAALRAGRVELVAVSGRAPRGQAD